MYIMRSWAPAGTYYERYDIALKTYHDIVSKTLSLLWREMIRLNKIGFFGNTSKRIEVRCGDSFDTGVQLVCESGNAIKEAIDYATSQNYVDGGVVLAVVKLEDPVSMGAFIKMVKRSVLEFDYRRHHGLA